MSGPQRHGRSIRTPLARVRHLGSAKSGTHHFWQQRITSVALIPLTIAFVILIISLLGRNHAAVVQILGSPLVAIMMLLFVGFAAHHMWQGMQVIIEDYVHEELPKMLLLIINTLFCLAVAVAAVFAVLKLSFGV